MKAKTWVKHNREFMLFLTEKGNLSLGIPHPSREKWLKFFDEKLTALYAEFQNEQEGDEDV